MDETESKFPPEGIHINWKEKYHWLDSNECSVVDNRSGTISRLNCDGEHEFIFMGIGTLENID